MVEVHISGVIDSRRSDDYRRMGGFSLEDLYDVFRNNPRETDFTFKINSLGGSVGEGIAIYDVMRMSGKNISCHIDGGCHSTAIIILLAAPFENRSANPNASALMHDVTGYVQQLTARDAQGFADSLLRVRNSILTIYEERTGINRNTLETLMLEERERSVAELLEWGFISKINSYTNKTNINMSKPTLANKVARAIGSFLSTTVKNFDFNDADGKPLFSTEKDDDSLAVGDPASPDGTFELPDGRTVTIATGAITEITDPAEEEAELQEQVANLSTQLKVATNLLRKAQGEINKLSGVRSNAKIPARIGLTGKAAKQNQNQNPEERKNAIRKGLNGKKGGE